MRRVCLISMFLERLLIGSVPVVILILSDVH
jgi:hypothetical protein